MQDERKKETELVNLDPSKLLLPKWRKQISRQVGLQQAKPLRGETDFFTLDRQNIELFESNNVFVGEDLKIAKCKF